MKHTRKILVALLVLMTILVSLVAVTIPASAATAGAGETLYLKPSDNWKEANAWFSAWFFEGTGADQMVKMTDTNSDGVYEVTIPSGGYKKVIFVRRDPSYSTLAWDGNWGQTANLEIPTSGSNNNCYNVVDWNDSGSGWTEYKVAIAGSFNGWSTTNYMTLSNGIATISLDLAASDTAYEFKILEMGNWAGNTSTISDSTSSDLIFKGSVSGNCKLNATGGTYVFTYNITTNKLSVHKHVWSDATCTQAQTCACGATNGEPAGHSYSKGTCSTCGAEDPDYVKVLFSVPDGVSPVEMVDGKILPSAGAPDGYTFAGWSESTIDETNTKPSILEAGSEYTGVATVLFAVYTRTETTGGSSAFEKVTEAPSDWSGQYLIVYESGKVAFNGALTTLDAVSNTVSVTISNGKITATDILKGAMFTIAKSGSNYTIKSASGYYIGQTSNDNGLKSNKSTTYDNTISINSDGSVNFVSGGAYLRYNSASNQLRFRYYKSSSYTGQKAIHLYKFSETVGTTTTYYCTLSDSVCDHDYESVVTNPTCTAAGYTTHTCPKCGDSYVDSNVAALGHNYVETSTTAATCTDAGSKVSTCSVCGDVKTETIKALGHNYVNGKCSACGEKEPNKQTVKVNIADYAAANGWQNEQKYSSLTMDSNVTVTVSGTPNTGKYYTSGTNWRVYQTENPKIVVAATNGATILSVKITYSVNNTGVLTLNGTNISSGTSVSVNADSITFGVGNTGSATNGQVRITAIEVVYAIAEECTHTNTTTTTENATCTTAGSVTVVCDDCGETISTSEIPATGHTWVAGKVVAPTCIAGGYTNYACACGETKTDDAVDALGHNEQSHEAKAPTCTEKGWDAYVTCSRCDYTTYVEKSALGHDLVSVVGKAATCTEDGYTAYKDCSRCDYIEGKETIEALGHDMVAGTVVAPTFDAAGYTVYTCANGCGKTENRDSVPALVAVAKIGETKYESLQEAFDAAVSGDTITLLADTKASKYIDVKTENNGEIARTLDLDLNGHTISPAEGYNYNTGYPLVFVGINQTLTIKGEGTITADKKVTVGVYGILTVTSGNIVNNGTTDKDAALAIFYWNNDLPSYEGIVGGTAFVTGGSFVGDVYCDEPDEDGKATLEISGGSFTTDVSDYCADGFDCKDNGDGSFDVAVHVHSYNAVVTKPTCETEGYTTHTCICGNSYQDTVVAASGHTAVTDAAKDPTCTETGLTEGSHCSVCSKTLVEQTVVSEKGHTPAEAVKEDVVDATCSAEGSYNLVVYCSVCDEKLSSEAKTEAKLDHTPADAVEENRTESTCTVAGSYESVVYCSVCKTYEISRNKVDLPLADHNYVGGKCSACGDTDPDAIYVAQVGSEKFVSLQDAENAAKDGDTIILLCDFTLENMVTFFNSASERMVTLNMNGKTITLCESWPNATAKSAFWVCDGLTITGNGTINAAPAGDAWAYAIIVGHRTSGTTDGYTGKLVIENGTFYSDDSSAVSVTNGSVTILGGTFEAAGDMLLNCVDDMHAAGKASITVSGGSFVGFNPANNASEGANTDFCAESYTAVESEGVYTVVEAIAKIGTTKFASLEAAFAAAVSGDEIVLLSDIEIASALADAGKGYFNIADGVNITLDLNGKTIDVTDNSTGNFIVFYNYGEFTIKNGTVNLTATNNRAWNAQSTILLNRGGVANVVSGTYTHNGGTDMAFALDNSGNWYGDATMNITGGTITSTYTAIRNRMEQNSHGASGEAILNISGGEISGTTSAIWAQAASTSTTSPATGEINVSGGTVGNINTARSEGAVSMTTISGGTVAGFKGEVGELTVNGGTLTGDVTILTAAGEAADYAVNADGVYVSAVAKIGEVNYATLLDALLAAAESDSASEIKLLQSVREKMPTDIELIVNADLLITADSAVTAQFYNEGTNYDFIFNSNNNNTITIGENVTFQLEDRVIWLGYYGNNVDVVVDGTLAGYQIWHGADTTVSATGTLKTTGEALILRRGATLTVDGGKIEANYFNILSGHIFAENATIDCGAFWIANTGSYPNESNVNISIWNSTMTSSGNLKSASDHSAGVNIDVYDSVVSFVDFDGYGASQISDNTTLEVNGENAALTIKSLNNNGVIDVYDSASFTVTGAATNNGTITLEAGSSIEGPENMGVITGSNGYEIVYENGKYTAKTIDYVAAINGVNYETLAEALAEAKDGDVITLYWAEGDDPIAMNGAVFGKTVTITGTALVDWDKGFLFIGRGGAGDGTVIFENAKLTSASESKSYGIHVSGREKDTTNKYNGTLIINNSTIELDYLINKGNITLDNSTLTVKNGFSIGGRPAVETESGEDATATINLTNSSKLVVNNHNGMGLGYEAIGIMNVTEGSTFECTQSFLITAKGTLNVDGGSVIIAGTLTNLGVNTTFKDATVKINKLNNGAALFIEGENTIQIEDVSGSSYAIRAKDGAIFNDSYMPGTSNETLRLLGSATFNGGFKCAYLQGAGASQGGIGGTVTIEDGTVIEVSYGVEFSNDYLLNGGSIKLSGGNASGGIWGFVFQNSNFEINTDISVDGGESYAPIHFTDAVATINSSITQVNSHGEPLYIDDDSVVTLGSNALINTLSVHGAGKLILDVTGMTDGEYANVKCSASGFTGTLETVGNDILSAEIVDGKIVLVDISVAKIGDKFFASIQAAVDAAAAGDVIVLTKDVVLTEGVVIAKDDSITLDLAGKTISMNDASGKTAYAIRNNGTLTVKDSVGNGTILFETSTPSMSNSYASNAISNYGTITIESGTIKNNSVGGACYALDNYAGSTATINGGKLMAVKSTVRIFNWTDGDASKATLTVNGGEIISDLGYAITFNMGNTPAVELNINGGTVTTNDPNYNLAVYIISKGDAKNLAIKVTDGTFNGYFALNGVTSTTMADGNISIEGGKFDGVICYGEPAFGFVSGGSFVVKPEANVCAEGCAFAENADGGFGIVEAKVTLNGYGYASFEEALEAANDGDTIALLDDVSFDEVLVLDKAITISANGKAITAAIKVSANVVIDNAVINGVAGNVAVITITGDAKLTVQGGKIVAAKAMSARSGSALSTDNQYILLAEGTNGASAYLDTELDYADKNIFIGDANTITVSVKEAYKADLAARGFVAGEADGNGMVAISGSVPYYIGENGNWFFNGEDTGKKAIGTDGNNFTIGSDGYWYLNGEITEYKAVAKDADQYTIGDDGYWYLNGSKTEFKALGTDGKNYTIGSDGYWYLNGEITEHKAVGTDGDKVEIRDDGYWYINDVKTEYKAVGEPGQTPQFKIEDGNLKASFDGVAWEDLGPVVAAKPLFKIEDGVLKLSYDNVNWEPLGTVAGEAGSKITIEKVGDNYYWHIDDVNTNVKAEGVDGTKVTLEKVDGVYYWHIDGVNSGVKAEGIDGAAGTKVTLQQVDGVFYWFLDGVNSGVKAEGVDGSAPTISEDGFWVIGGVKTSYSAVGKDGKNYTIGEDGYWYCDGVKTEYRAIGVDGKTPTFKIDAGNLYVSYDNGENWTNLGRVVGEDGKTPYIGENGNWWIGDTDTEVPAQGQDGKAPFIGENGNWWIGDKDTGISATGNSDSDMKEIIMLCIGMAILCVITILVAIITRKSRSRWWVLS